MANTKINWTPSSSGNRNTWTWSGWVKRNGLGATQTLFGAYQNSSYNTKLQFNSVDRIHFGDLYNNSPHAEIVTEAKYRDTSGWYNIVVNYDKANSTTNDKIRMYVNGERIIAMSSGPDRPTQSSTLNSDGIAIQHGALASTTYFNGVMSHVHFCDGYSYDASKFGSVDSVTGEWKINTSPSVNYGNNGFTILKDGNTITDQTSGSNNFSLSGGALTNTKDCPSNVMATMNPLSTNDANGNFTNGNTANSTGASAWRTMFSTLAASSGKWYCEMKYVSGSNQMFGIFSLDKKSNVKNIGYVGDNNSGTQAVGLAKGGDYYINGNTSTYTGGSNTSWTTGDIIQIALDRDNSKVYFGKNGTWMGSGNPASGSTGTGAISFSPDSNSFWGFATSVNASASATNFGNGFFGTTAITTNSGNGYAGAEGASKFNYQPPSGYSALSTKGLNT